MDYILELAKTLNFNRAAENLFISQPTMTYQINAAEEEIGFRIFERSGKGASLTPAGGQFVMELQGIRDRLKIAIEQGQNFSAKYSEDIRIATLTNVASHRGVCLALGFLNDHNNEFAWTPFDCSEVIPCVLCTHKNDRRESVMEFVKILQDLYIYNKDFSE